LARGDQLGRQWKIIQTLLSSQRGKAAADLAEELGCHSRTVYRDLEALQIAGFPIYTERFEGRTLWSILDTVKNQIPLPLNLTELTALYFSRNMLKILKNTVYYDSLESLFEKIKTTLPEEYLTALEQFQKGFGVGLKPHKDYEGTGQTIRLINQAVMDQKYIVIDYFTMSRNQQTRRRVAPYKVWFFDDTFYLIGRCELRKAIRIFAMERIRHIEILDASFQKPDDDHIEDLMKSSFGVFLGKPAKVRIRFSADIAGYVKEKIWHETQMIREQEDGSIIFEAEVSGLSEIKFWIMKWGHQAKVLEPASLRHAIRQEAARMVSMYALKGKADRSPPDKNRT
jgi:predicted DNA-binding transcriptional regulator YafY